MYEALLTPLFFAAIAYCETRGEANPDAAVGRDSSSLGRYQITKIYVDDVNRIVRQTGDKRSEFTYDDRLDPVRSEEMIKVYLGHYGARIGRMSGKVLLDWELALMHHAGPTGWRRGRTDHYVVTFQEYLRQH